MEQKIVSIRIMKARRDPDYYVRMVSPEAMAARIEARRQADRDAEALRRKAADQRAADLRQADLATLILKVMLASGAVGWLAALAGMM